MCVNVRAGMKLICFQWTMALLSYGIVEVYLKINMIVSIHAIPRDCYTVKPRYCDLGTHDIPVLPMVHLQSGQVIG